MPISVERLGGVRAQSASRTVLGGEHDGVLSGAEWVPGRSGPGLRFGGDPADKVLVASSSDLELTEGFTIDAWVKPGKKYRYYPVVEKETPVSFGYELALEGGVWPAAYVSPEGTVEEGVVAGEPIPRHVWSNVAVTYDRTDLRLYVDGELSGTEAVNAPQGGAGALRIGSSEPFGFTGKIDELRIYERALDGEEIQMDEATPIGTTEGSGGEEIEPDEVEVREETAIVYDDNGSTAEFRRIQGETDWSPASAR